MNKCLQSAYNARYHLPVILHSQLVTTLQSPCSHNSTVNLQSQSTTILVNLRSKLTSILLSPCSHSQPQFYCQPAVTVNHNSSQPKVKVDHNSTVILQLQSTTILLPIYCQPAVTVNQNSVNLQSQSITTLRSPFSHSQSQSYYHSAVTVDHNSTVC